MCPLKVQSRKLFLIKFELAKPRESPDIKNSFFLIKTIFFISFCKPKLIFTSSHQIGKTILINTTINNIKILVCSLRSYLEKGEKGIAKSGFLINIYNLCNDLNIL